MSDTELRVVIVGVGNASTIVRLPIEDDDGRGAFVVVVEVVD